MMSTQPYEVVSVVDPFAPPVQDSLANKTTVAFTVKALFSDGEDGQVTLNQQARQLLNVLCNAEKIILILAADEQEYQRIQHALPGLGLNSDERVILSRRSLGLQALGPNEWRTTIQHLMDYSKNTSPESYFLIITPEEYEKDRLALRGYVYPCYQTAILKRRQERGFCASRRVSFAPATDMIPAHQELYDRFFDPNRAQQIHREDQADKRSAYRLVAVVMGSMAFYLAGLGLGCALTGVGSIVGFAIAALAGLVALIAWMMVGARPAPEYDRYIAMRP